MIRFLWKSSRGYRLRPWASPYFRWRVETYWGVPASELDNAAMRRFVWRHRDELCRFLHWAGRMGRGRS
ncbi:MAG: hypothetical protein IT160_19145 [Bryobacterales bacterium]|nr:hypothetical protein [Bryobacterales bacterium]